MASATLAKLNDIVNIAESNVLDDSEDEYEGQYEESHSIIASLDKQRNQNFTETPAFREALDEAVNQERQRLVHDEMERIYNEAKQNVEEQLESEVGSVKKDCSTSRTNPTARKANNEIMIRYSDDFADAEFNEVESMEGEMEPDLNEPTDMFIIDNESEFHEMKYEPPSPINRQNYMVLESGDVALTDGNEYYSADMVSEDDLQNGERSATVAILFSLFETFNLRQIISPRRFSERRVFG